METSAPCSTPAALLAATPVEMACSAAACWRGRSRVVSTTRSFLRLAHQAADLVVDPVGEILRPLVGQHRIDADLGGEGLVALGRGDEARLDHLVQHDGGALLGAVGGRHRVVGEAAHQAGQEGRLAQGQLGRALAEIALRGGFDAT